MYPGKWAALKPDAPAVIMSGSGASLSYAELEAGSVRLARLMRDAGLRPGDCVALLSDNNPRCYEIYWAAQRSGLYITAVNRHLAPSEVAYIVSDCGAKGLFASAAKAELAEAVVAEGLPEVRLRLSFGGDVKGYERYEPAVAAFPPAPMGDQPRGADMLYSSGTTGRPKGIRPPLPQRQVNEPGDPLVALFGSRYGFGPDTVYLSPAPVYHAAPLRFGAVVHALGGTIVMMERFDPEQALAAIERYRVTHTQMVPTMFVRMLKLPQDVRDGYDLSSLRVAVHAAAPCPVDAKQAMMRWWGPILHEYYSCTETNGITLIGPDEWLRRPGSVGRAGIGVPHVCDDEGRELPTGEIGTIYFERDELPFEYHNDPERTQAAQHPRHPTWTTVGDVGHLDDDGYLFLTDRKNFMIISGGVNIYPQEIENVLVMHPDVIDAAVIGIPDDEMGEQVRAVVQAAEGVEAGSELEQRLIAFVRRHIAHYKAPRSIDFVDRLPRTPTGKLVKGRLRDRYLSQGVDVGDR
ncbi:acyl-CoA synthetase [Streptomyces leeuwenhoekii]|uniref:Long-chain-fatty-acid--CoA ligase n=1 Tax=Streptomyces leeuwenhoekii TaxID=1437453 RepID=A0A0F7W8G6_STRLW|nr:acyl-CoA synthetase [Streptomyces leeuwenhoekii]CQR65586.1 Long-chain-fatty-acid--CoA ligase [Streptomyces leeuwenhoekii]